MSVGPAGAAGTPIGQTSGTDLQKNAHEAANQQRKSDSVQNAEQSQGVGQTEADEQTADRDADGRRHRRFQEADTPVSTPLPPVDDQEAPGSRLDLTG